MGGGMKWLLLLTALMALNSCNTLIGLGRDTKQAFQWTRAKMQGHGSPSSQGGYEATPDAGYGNDPYGAPVY